MKDDELRKLLQNSLSGRRAPTEVRERIVSALRPRRKLRLSVSLAAAVVVAVTIALAVPRATKLSPVLARAVEQHMQTTVIDQPACSATPREVAQTVSDARGRDIQVPGLRDGGFTQMQAHRCESTGWAHVIYTNSWLKVSCFLLDSGELDLSDGTPLQVPGLEAYSFAHDRFSVVAVRESGLAKIWVGELRAQNLAAIAVDAEQKRHQLQTVAFSVASRGIAKQLEAMLGSTPGIEDIQIESSKQEAYVRFDRRRVTVDHIAAILATNEIAASPRD